MRIKELLEYQIRPMVDIPDYGDGSPELNDEWADHASNVREHIEKNCGEILQHYQNTGKFLTLSCDVEHPLFRAKIKPADERGMGEELGVSILHDKGMVANYHNSLKCSPDADAANFIILPFDGFQYTWCPTSRNLPVVSHLTIEDASNFEDARDILSHTDFSKTDFSNALLGNHEVFITGSDYYGLNTEIWRKYLGFWWNI